MSSIRALLIEDDRFLRKACEVGLKKQGFVVLTAEDGESGIQQAMDGSPDIILLDMLMPGLSGIETLKVLKSEERTRAIPVVILSNSSVEADIQKAMDLGAAGYLVKASLSLQELGRHVRSFLDKQSDS
ncbi:MAG: response regulator [Acidobacteria bacterium]|nr:response regulator [Acidobacteriota bacterium]